MTKIQGKFQSLSKCTITFVHDFGMDKSSSLTSRCQAFDISGAAAGGASKAGSFAGMPWHSQRGMTWWITCAVSRWGSAKRPSTISTKGFASKDCTVDSRWRGSSTGWASKKSYSHWTALSWRLLWDVMLKNVVNPAIPANQRLNLEHPEKYEQYVPHLKLYWPSGFWNFVALKEFTIMLAHVKAVPTSTFNLMEQSRISSDTKLFKLQGDSYLVLELLDLI